jgi:hypothetical protein
VFWYRQEVFGTESRWVLYTPMKAVVARFVTRAELLKSCANYPTVPEWRPDWVAAPKTEPIGTVRETKSP